MNEADRKLVESASRCFAGHGDVVWVAAKRGDVRFHPLESGDLVEEPIVGRLLVAEWLKVEPAEGPQSVLNGHYDDVASFGVSAAVVQVVTRAAPGECAPMDPDHRWPWRAVEARRPDVEGDAGPNSVASRGSIQGSAGWGGCQRRGPIGGAAYGIALNTAWACSLTPRTGPLSVLTIGLSPVLVMELPVLSSDGFAPRA